VEFKVNNIPSPAEIDPMEGDFTVDSDKDVVAPALAMMGMAMVTNADKDSVKSLGHYMLKKPKLLPYLTEELKTQYDTNAESEDLMQARQALGQLRKQDVSEIRAMAKPPLTVLKVLAASYTLRNGNEDQKPISELYQLGKAELNNASYIQKLLDFDVNNISESNLVDVQPLIDDPDLTHERIKKVSHFSDILMEWVQAVYQHGKILQQVRISDQGDTTSNDQYDFLFKVILIGDTKTGKSNILSRFTKGEFTTEEVSTIGVDFATKTIQKDGKYIKCQIWDTAGQERFRTIAQSYYRGAMAALIVYDITQQSTFEDAAKWVRQFREYADEKAALMLVGNKSDLSSQREVNIEDAKALADEHNMMFIEVSAKSAFGVETAFHRIISKVYERLSNTQV